MSESDELTKREQPSILNELEVRCRVDRVEIERWDEWVSEHHYAEGPRDPARLAGVLGGWNRSASVIQIHPGRL